MSAGSDREQVARLELPGLGGRGCGVVFAIVFVGGFVGGFVALAVDNLIHYRTAPLLGLVPSVLWLALVAFVVVMTLVEIGVWGSLVACLGEFSRRHFAEAIRDGGRNVIGFGFVLLGRKFYYLRIQRGQVVSVVMNTGQATAMAGRDMNDWSVVVWYREPRGTPRFGFRAGEDVYIVGPAGAKQQTAQFFAGFVEFLRAAGVELHPGERENEFRAAAEAHPAPRSATDPPPPESRG
jgi:hypothetical protein